MRVGINFQKNEVFENIWRRRGRNEKMDETAMI